MLGTVKLQRGTNWDNKIMYSVYSVAVIMNTCTEIVVDDNRDLLLELRLVLTYDSSHRAKQLK